MKDGMVERLARESEDRARVFMATAPMCDVCHLRVATKGRTRHFSCEPGSLAGKRCSCPPGCTDQRYGDRGICDPKCLVCRIMASKPYGKGAA